MTNGEQTDHAQSKTNTPVEGKNSANSRSTEIQHLLHILEIIAIIVGGSWGVYTWSNQAKNYRASLVPALEVRIRADENLKHPKDFIKTDLNPNVVKGFVTIKNVGTSKTSLQLCECVPRKKKDEEQSGASRVSDTFMRCKRVKTAPWEMKNACPSEYDAKGPILVSKVCLEDDNTMTFIQTERFWLTRAPLDKSPKLVLSDEMRPSAEDKLEFLVKVPKDSPGIYAIMFAASLDDEEIHRMKEAGYTLPPWRLRWYETTFLEVKQTDNDVKSGPGPSPNLTCSQASSENATKIQ